MQITNMIQRIGLICCYFCMPFRVCKDCKDASVYWYFYWYEYIIAIASFNKFRILK